MQWISSEIKLKKHHCTRLNPKPYFGTYYISGANTNNNRKYGDPDMNPPTSRIAPLWGKGDPPILVTGVLPRPLGKTQAGRNTWQHTCSLESPEFKDTLLIARAKKGTKCTPEEHMIILHALKHEKLVLLDPPHS